VAAELKSEPMLLRWLAKTGGLQVPAGEVGVAGEASMGTGVAALDAADGVDGVGLVRREFRNKANGSGPSRLLRFVNWRTRLSRVEKSDSAVRIWKVSSSSSSSSSAELPLPETPFSASWRRVSQHFFSELSRWRACSGLVPPPPSTSCCSPVTS